MKNYYHDRVKNLCKTLNLDTGLIISHPQDIFYLTGIELSKGIVLMAQDRAVLFVDGRYIAAAKSASPFDVEPLEKEAFAASFPAINTWAVDASKITLEEMKWWETKLEGKKFTQLVSPVLKVRAEKSSVEIELLEESAQLLIKGVRHVMAYLKEGISEKQVALEFEMFCKKQGAEKLSFDSIVAFGEKGAYPHYHPGENKLRKGDAVLLDMGVMKGGYASDMTRTFCFEGSFAPRMQLLFDVTAKAKEAAMKLCKAGACIADLDLAARKVMKDHGLESLYPHGLGHGVGLDIHELPVVNKRNDDVLKENMVITIEPGLYEPGVGGVRLEDTIAITKEGYVNFFETLPI